MARYIQRIALLGKERWIGWEVDGVGTEVPGLILADSMSDEEIRARGIREFHPMPFETFIGMGSAARGGDGELLDEDIAFRLDALQVGMDRYRSRGLSEVPRVLLTGIFTDERQLEDPRVQARFRAWENAGWIEVVGKEECYLRIRTRMLDEA